MYLISNVMYSIVTIEGYLSNDKDGKIRLHANKPKYEKGLWISDGDTIDFPQGILQFERTFNPMKVELIIKRSK